MLTCLFPLSSGYLNQCRNNKPTFCLFSVAGLLGPCIGSSWTAYYSFHCGIPPLLVKSLGSINQRGIPTFDSRSNTAHHVGSATLWRVLSLPEPQHQAPNGTETGISDSNIGVSRALADSGCVSGNHRLGNPTPPWKTDAAAKDAVAG